MVSATLLAITACSSDSRGPDPINVSFRIQPSDIEAGSPILPAIEVTTDSEAPQSADAASLAWVSDDDLVWTADDNTSQVCGFDRRSGLCANPVTQEEFLTAFPAAADCDDGDGNPATSCSFSNELEVVAYDGVGEFIYVFNTVNDPGSAVVVDRPAVYRMRPGDCRGCVNFDAWKELPVEYSYRAAVAIDGLLYISNGPDLHRYDFDQNSVTAEPVLQSSGSAITGLSFWGGELYLLNRSRQLSTMDWEEGEFEDSYDLSPTGVQSANGVEVVRDTVYVLEGEPQNPIYVLTIDPVDF